LDARRVIQGAVSQPSATGGVGELGCRIAQGYPGGEGSSSGPDVGVGEIRGVAVRVGVGVLVGVRVGVAEVPTDVGVTVGPSNVGVRVGEAVRVGVRVGEAVRVGVGDRTRVGVLVGRTPVSSKMCSSAMASKSGGEPRRSRIQRQLISASSVNPAASYTRARRA
jgi:hypothetical protein